MTFLSWMKPKKKEPKCECMKGPNVPYLWTCNPCRAQIIKDLVAERKAQKQASRDEDARRLAAGEVTPAELKKENSHFANLKAEPDLHEADYRRVVSLVKEIGMTKILQHLIRYIDECTETPYLHKLKKSLIVALADYIARYEEEHEHD